MNNAPSLPAPRHAVITLGFAMAVAMWLVGYLGRMPIAAAHVPASILVIMMLAVGVAGGWALRRRAGTGLGAAAVAGLVTGVINLLIVGSVIATLPDDQQMTGAPSAWLWIPGSLVATVLAAVIGAALAGRPAGPTPDAAGWRARFAAVAAVAALLTLIAGGIVTSTEQGLAVPDWPTSFGANMFLYPLRQMTGGIFLEHAHRLYGALVGLTMIAMLGMFIAGRKRPEIVIASICMVLVVVQGVVGGIRVTNTSVALAAVHGIVGQLFFVLVTMAWAVAAWGRGARGGGTGGDVDRKLDGKLTHALAGLAFVQVVFGALYRHMYTPEMPLPWPAHVHLLFAAIVSVLGAIVAFRAWARNAPESILRRLGAAFMVVITIQVLAGIAALIALFVRPEDATAPPPMEVVLATLHQANGALFFAITAQMEFWTRRA